LTDIQVGWLAGVTIMTEKQIIRLDPTTKGRTNTLISHAHGDHTAGVGKDTEVYLTSETRNILTSSRGRPLETCRILRYGEEVAITDDVTVKTHNAGHILGSAQFEIESPESTIVYTGDLNCRDMLTTNAAEPIPCDTLILETTYGNPYYVFPSLGEVCTAIVNWILEKTHEGKIPVFRVYSVGKAQELIKLANEFTTIPVVTHPLISRVNDAYMKSGIELTYLDEESREGEEALKVGQCAYIIPTSEETPVGERYSLAIATGWALRNRTNSMDAAFPLSNHADFNQLLDYIEQAKPKQVYTVHGFKEDFIKHIRKRLHIKAQPIAPIAQTGLREYV